MSNTNTKRNRTGNAIKLVIFCAAIGAVCGIVFWLFLFLIQKGTWLIWDLVPDKILPVVWYPVLACTVGGLIIGLFRKKFGDYPEEMMVVFGKLKKTKTYPYRKILIILIAALLPLIFGSSVGPEAGMVGVIVALCCWAGDNLKFAGSRSAYYCRVGAAVSLSVLFRSPLFGVLNAAEEGENDPEEDPALGRGEKIILYCIAIGAGFGANWLLNHFIVKVSSGFPSFDTISLRKEDYFLFLLYLICGILLGLFFEYTEKLFAMIGKKIPSVLSEVIAGLILGIITTYLPVVRFSGEEQMQVLISDFAKYAPLAMIGIAFLKIVVTNMCIRLGLKGGHFFPLIFSAVCLGYGLSLLFFPNDASHAIFAAAIVAAGTLGVSLKKPLAVSVLLLLCFPVKALLWIVPASALAAFAGKLLARRSS